MVLGTNCICYKNPKWLSCVDENFVPMTYTALSGKRLKVFSPKSETWIVCPLLPCYSNLYLNFSQKNWTRKGDKNYWNCKGRAKSSLFTGGIIIYIKNPWESIRKLPEYSKYMNVVTLQDRRWRHKIQLWFCTPAVNSPQRNLHFIYSLICNSI